MTARFENPPTINASGVVFDPSANAGDCIWSPEHARRAVNFFSDCLQHTKGPAAGKPFILEPWQADVNATMYGWLRPDGTRRFRKSFRTVPRKNGKTTWTAGEALFVMLCDGEARGENYCAGADREQASLAFATAAAMLRANKDLKDVCKVVDSQRRIIYRDSFLRAIPANEEASHGFDISFLCGDELHAWPTRKMYDVLQTGMGARPQPVCIWITTAGHDRESICYKEYSYAKGVRDGKIDDPYYLPVIYEAEENDDWQDPEVWKKSNPNFGISLREDYMAAECNRAINEPSYQNTFRRLHCNQWTSQKMRWLMMDDWRKCATTQTDFERETVVFAGLDLSATTDLTCVCLAARTPGGGFKLRPHFWIPEKRMHEIEKRDRVPYSTWADQGHLTVIPGHRIDQSWIEKFIVEACERYNVRYVGFDPWNAEGLSMRLESAGVPMVKVRQGAATLSAPCKELEACVLAGTLDHGENPMLGWCAENVEVHADHNGNIRPVRPPHGSGKKIDGIVAAVMALGVAIAAGQSAGSIYETRGPILV